MSSDNNTPNIVTNGNFAVLPDIRGVSKRVSIVLRSNNLKVGFKPLNTLRARFPLPKDKRSALQSRCVVYKIGCSDCNFVYYGQTDRALATRIKEHRRAVRVGDNNSKIARESVWPLYRF